MNPGEGRSSRRDGRSRRRPPWLGGLLGVLACALLPGCVFDRAAIEQKLQADRDARTAEVAQQYRVACPDVLEVRLAQRPELSGLYTVGPAGRINLADYASLRVESRPPSEIAQMIAEETGQSPSDVEVRVVQYRSQQLVLFGQVFGWQRSVPYQGPETVLDLLKRVGGITPDAEPEDVYVVRPHISESQRPEVFRVDLKNVVLRGDNRTNLRLMPFDQIYVGESRAAHAEKWLPPWLRPVYEAFWGIRPENGR
jgi:protein involved in polysaccharide export with SLBB domain